MSDTIKNIIITGLPGVGKTFLMCNIHKELKKRNVNCHGFITEEVRPPDSIDRIGFDVVSLEGKRGVLSRTKNYENLPHPKVGKYSVYIKEFENFAIPLITLDSNFETTQLLIIDEIGKMELKSKNFEIAVRKVIDRIPMLVSIPFRTNSRLPLVDELKQSSRSKVFEITKKNRDEMLILILEFIKNILKIT